MSMAKIELFPDGSIRCDNKPCDPLRLWEGNGACGDCPIIVWGEEFCNAYFEDAIFTTRVQARVEK